MTTHAMNHAHPVQVPQSAMGWSPLTTVVVGIQANKAKTEAWDGPLDTLWNGIIRVAQNVTASPEGDSMGCVQPQFLVALCSKLLKVIQRARHLSFDGSGSLSSWDP